MLTSVLALRGALWYNRATFVLQAIVALDYDLALTWNLEIDFICH